MSTQFLGEAGLKELIALTKKHVANAHVASATKATQDANGNVITTTYATKQELSDSAYVLPVASATTLGGIKIGNNLSVSEDGTLSVTVANTYSSTGMQPVSGTVIAAALANSGIDITDEGDGNITITSTDGKTNVIIK